MQTAFQRENHSSFLMIREPEDEGRTQYPYRMILRNRIPGLLSCTELFREGEAWLCYDISGRQPVRALFEGQTLKAAQMRRFLEAVEQAFAACGNFLLDDRYLCLDPGLIYWDAANEEYAFVYYPGEKEREDGFHRLADFFLDCASTQEEQSVYFAYRFYQQTKKKFFSLSAFLDAEEGSTGKEGDFAAAEETPRLAERKRLAPAEAAEAIEEENIRYTEIQEAISDAGSRRAERRELPEKRGIRRLWHSLRLPKSVKKQEKAEDAYASRIWETYDNGPEQAKAMWEEEERERPEVTVFMDNRRRNPEDGRSRHSLIAIVGSGGTEQEFILEKFPVLVGKTKGQTDLVIEEPTVSRMHARFFLKEKKIMLMDLNSKNGTFVNGLRLEPEEQVALETEDEICFGEAKFRFS